MKYIGCGGARVVFLEDNYIIKIPYSISGIVENKTEAEQYAKDHNPYLASCELMDNGWLKMEYLPENLTFEYACYKDNNQCARYDTDKQKYIPPHYDCNFDCANCGDRVTPMSFPQAAELEEAAEGLRVQCGRAANGTVKVYDYGTDNTEEYKKRPHFVFNEGYLDLFMDFVERNEPEVFAEWAVDHIKEIWPLRKEPAGKALCEWNHRVRMNAINRKKK